MGEAFINRFFAPGEVLGWAAGAGFFRFEALGKGDEALCGVGRAVEEHILDEGEEVFRDLLVDGELAGVDDAHVEAGFDGVVEERGVDGFADRVVSLEGERDVAHAAAHAGVREVFLDPAGGVDEGLGVFIVLLDAGADGEDVWVENDVFGREADFIDEGAVGAFADFGFALERVGLALFVEGHDDHGGSVGANEAGLLFEFFGTFLEADRIHDALALDAAQAGFEDFPFRRVDHEGNLGNIGLGGDEVQIFCHRGGTIEHAVVHVHIDDLRAGLDLLAGNREGSGVVLSEDEFFENLRAGDIRALADVDEGNLRACGEGLKPTEAQRGGAGGDFAGREFAHRIGHGLNVGGCGAAATADDVQPALLGPFAELRGEGFGGFGKAGGRERVGQAGIWVGADEEGREV